MDGSENALIGVWHGSPSGPERLALYEDGTFAGHDGCNPFRGTYVRDGDEVALRLAFTTRKGCLGVDTWLRKARAGTLTAEGLALRDAEGTPIGVLPAKD